MPLPNEHAARQEDPDGFVSFRRGTLPGAPEGISVIYGIREDGSSEAQSIRADAGKLTVDEFRSWLGSVNLKASIEEAVGVMADTAEKYAEWTAAFINTLPDSAFLYVGPGGEKDEEGKTKPRSLRYFPYRDADGEIDLPHLRNAIARIPQSTAPGLTGERARAIQEKARKMLRDENEGEDLSEAPGFWGAPRSLPGFQIEALAGPGLRSYVEIVRSGTFYGNTGPKPRKVELTREDILQMASSFEVVLTESWFNGGPPVGFNHASAFGARDAESTKAAARIEQVEVRESPHGGLSLWGLFAWTDEGARRVASGEFAAISAELIPPTSATSKLTGEPINAWTLVGATLTNSPMIPGMQAPSVSDTVAATERGAPLRVCLSDAASNNEERKMKDILVRLAEATGLPADGAELLAEIKRLQADAGKVATLTEALETATTDLEAFREKTVALEDREKTRILDAACSAGRIAPTERDDYWSVLSTLGEDKANRLFAEGRLPVTRESAQVEASEPDAVAPHDSFLSMLDSARTEGLSEAEAWDRARVQLGGNLYTQEN